MDILIVEDDDHKLAEIQAIVLDCVPESKIEYTNNVRDTIIFLQNQKPDAILLDMSLPSHPGRPGEGNPVPMPDGGVEVILELRSLSCSNIPIVVITQYPGIEIEAEYFGIPDAQPKLASLYGITNLSVTQHESNDQYWKSVVKRFLLSI